MKIFKCKNCGKIIIVAKNSESDIVCCGNKMQELIANDVDAAVEKHVPVLKKAGDSIVVTCGEVLHPMEEKHFIEFMVLETNKGYTIKYLKPGMEPVCSFQIMDDEELISVYAYCNLHGLWVNN